MRKIMLLGTLLSLGLTMAAPMAEAQYYHHHHRHWHHHHHHGY